MKLSAQDTKSNEVVVILLRLQVSARDLTPKLRYKLDIWSPFFMIRLCNYAQFYVVTCLKG